MTILKASARLLAVCIFILLAFTSSENDMGDPSEVSTLVQAGADRYRLMKQITDYVDDESDRNSKVPDHHIANGQVKSPGYTTKDAHVTAGGKYKLGSGRRRIGSGFGRRRRTVEVPDKNKKANDDRRMLNFRKALTKKKTDWIFRKYNGGKGFNAKPKRKLTNEMQVKILRMYHTTVEVAKAGPSFFEKANYKGAKLQTPTSVPNCSERKELTQPISSVEVPAGFCVTLFTEPKYQGQHTKICGPKSLWSLSTIPLAKKFPKYQHQGSNTVRNISWDNQAHSLKITKWQYNYAKKAAKCITTCGTKKHMHSGRVGCLQTGGLAKRKQVALDICKNVGLLRPRRNTRSCPPRPLCVRYITEKWQGKCSKKCGLQSKTHKGKVLCQRIRSKKIVAHRECEFKDWKHVKPALPLTICRETKKCMYHSKAGELSIKKNRKAKLAALTRAENRNMALDKLPQPAAVALEFTQAAAKADEVVPSEHASPLMSLAAGQRYKMSQARLRILMLHEKIQKRRAKNRAAKKAADQAANKGHNKNRAVTKATNNKAIVQAKAKAAAKAKEANAKAKEANAKAAAKAKEANAKAAAKAKEANAKKGGFTHMLKAAARHDKTHGSGTCAESGIKTRDDCAKRCWAGTKYGINKKWWKQMKVFEIGSVVTGCACKGPYVQFSCCDDKKNKSGRTSKEKFSTTCKGGKMPTSAPPCKCDKRGKLFKSSVKGKAVDFCYLTTKGKSWCTLTEGRWKGRRIKRVWALCHDEKLKRDWALGTVRCTGPRKYRHVHKPTDVVKCTSFSKCDSTTNHKAYTVAHPHGERYSKATAKKAMTTKLARMQHNLNGCGFFAYTTCAYAQMAKAKAALELGKAAAHCKRYSRTPYGAGSQRSFNRIKRKAPAKKGIMRWWHSDRHWKNNLDSSVYYDKSTCANNDADCKARPFFAGIREAPRNVARSWRQTSNRGYHTSKPSWMTARDYEWWQKGGGNTQLVQTELGMPGGTMAPSTNGRRLLGSSRRRAPPPRPPPPPPPPSYPPTNCQVSGLTAASMRATTKAAQEALLAKQYATCNKCKTYPFCGWYGRKGPCDNRLNPGKPWTNFGKEIKSLTLKLAKHTSVSKKLDRALALHERHMAYKMWSKTAKLQSSCKDTPYFQRTCQQLQKKKWEKECDSPRMQIRCKKSCSRYVPNLCNKSPFVSGACATATHKYVSKNKITTRRVTLSKCVSDCKANKSCAGVTVPKVYWSTEKPPKCKCKARRLENNAYDVCVMDQTKMISGTCLTEENVVYRRGSKAYCIGGKNDDSFKKFKRFRGGTMKPHKEIYENRFVKCPKIPQCSCFRNKNGHAITMKKKPKWSPVETWCTTIMAGNKPASSTNMCKTLNLDVFGDKTASLKCRSPTQKWGAIDCGCPKCRILKLNKILKKSDAAQSALQAKIKAWSATRALQMAAFTKRNAAKAGFRERRHKFKKKGEAQKAAFTKKEKAGKAKEMAYAKQYGENLNKQGKKKMQDAKKAAKTLEDGKNKAFGITGRIKIAKRNVISVQKKIATGKAVLKVSVTKFNKMKIPIKKNLSVLRCSFTTMKVKQSDPRRKACRKNVQAYVRAKFPLAAKYSDKKAGANLDIPIFGQKSFLRAPACKHLNINQATAGLNPKCFKFQAKVLRQQTAAQKMLGQIMTDPGIEMGKLNNKLGGINWHIDTQTAKWKSKEGLLDSILVGNMSELKKETTHLAVHNIQVRRKYGRLGGVPRAVRKFYFAPRYKPVRSKLNKAKANQNKRIGQEKYNKAKIQRGGKRVAAQIRQEKEGKAVAAQYEKQKARIRKAHKREARNRRLVRKENKRKSTHRFKAIKKLKAMRHSAAIKAMRKRMAHNEKWRKTLKRRAHRAGVKIAERRNKESSWKHKHRLQIRKRELNTKKRQLENLNKSNWRNRRIGRRI